MRKLDSRECVAMMATDCGDFIKPADAELISLAPDMAEAILDQADACQDQDAGCWRESSQDNLCDVCELAKKLEAIGKP